MICPTKDCGQVCEIKIASGYKDPKNKGKKYIKCLKCDGFSWVDPEDSKQSPQTPATPQKGTETREPVPDEVSFKVRDFDAENRGKVRNTLIGARTQLVGLMPMTSNEFDALTQLTEIVMTGKFPQSSEDIEDIELPSEILKDSSAGQTDQNKGEE